MTDHSPPKGWERFETPFASYSDNDVWQYGERPVTAGEEIETREWPHPSFRALNYSAGRVLDFFNSRTRSRMAISPFQNGRVVLDDGLTGTSAPTLLIKTGDAA